MQHEYSGTEFCEKACFVVRDGPHGDDVREQGRRGRDQAPRLRLAAVVRRRRPAAGADEHADEEPVEEVKAAAPRNSGRRAATMERRPVDVTVTGANLAAARRAARAKALIALLNVCRCVSRVALGQRSVGLPGASCC